MSKNLEGQLALVTGASRGIGAATAEALARAGAHVILTARTAKDLEAIEERIHQDGGTATIAPMDLLDTDGITRLADAIGGRWDKLNALVLNAATLGTLAAVPAIDTKEFVRLLTLNIASQQALIAAFDPLLRRAEPGKLVAVTSSVGATPRAYWGAYGASKAALETLVSAYGEEQRNLGRVNVAIIDPGATRTKMRERAFPGEDPETLKGPEIVGERIAALIAGGFESGYRERIER